MYLDEIRRELDERRGVLASTPTLWRILKFSGYTLKKITKVAIERDARKRAQFRLNYARLYRADQLIFVDESSFDRRTPYRRRGWAVSGRRVYKSTFFVRGRRYSLLPALASTGIIYAKVIEGSFTALRFYAFIEALLTRMQPFPAPKPYHIPWHALFFPSTIFT
ncbi:related to Ant1 transposase-Aspergillus niger [Lentinula edodes]|uniref:Related to Ant1 transposase-Aspergillus niger n=1 Tax=Lentinula edodes TaxID=5353 RepID=A0A1Q3E9H2_LENED|nr:related to Ant1 transposase-Aspergillus niger [Lentinula edodes]